jgi:hypothetical protein
MPETHFVDFAPVGTLPRRAAPHALRFVGTTSDGKRIDFSVSFLTDKTPTQVRDIAFERIRSTTLGVKKIGETKVMIFGCKQLDIKTQAPLKKEFPENCRPTLKGFANGKPLPRDKDKSSTRTRPPPESGSGIARADLLGSNCLDRIAAEAVSVLFDLRWLVATRNCAGCCSRAGRRLRPGLVVREPPEHSATAHYG